MMSYFLFILKSAIFDFSRNKGRTFLTSLGILIGVLSVVLLMAMGLGLKKYIELQFENLGTNLLRIVPGQILQGGGFHSGPSAFGTIRFDEKDVISLNRIKKTAFVIPVFTRTITASGNGKNETGDLYASSSDIFAGLNLKPQYGRIFTKEEVNKKSKVITIGPKIAEKIFGDPSLAVDRRLKIEKQTFRIVGVLEAKGGGFGGPDLDSFVYMPYKTGYVFNPDKKFLTIIVKTENGESMNTVREQIIERLKKRYDEDDFSVIEQAELLGAISSIFSVINMVLVSIAAISLIVGGIGIMNIMYVTVTERIKEIGIRRAIGARKIDILSQFLIESVILSLIGGLLGILISYLLTLFIQKFFPAYIDLNSVLLALGVSSAIGIIFGVFPAKKAADLSPIDAIRYE